MKDSKFIIHHLRFFHTLSIWKSKSSCRLTVVMKSPTHLEIIKTIMIGSPKEISSVHSTIITVRLMVVRRIPPSWLAAPISANLPTSSCYQFFKKKSDVNNVIKREITLYHVYTVQNIQNYNTFFLIQYTVKHTYKKYACLQRIDAYSEVIFIPLYNENNENLYWI